MVIMKITQVKVYPYTKKKINGEVGIGQVVLDDMILLTGLKLIERNGKRFILYPVNYKNKQQLCFVQPIKKPIANSITEQLFNAYNIALINKTTKLNNFSDDSAFSNGILDMVNTFVNEQTQLSSSLTTLNQTEDTEINVDLSNEEA